MKKYLFMLAALATLVSACDKKDDTPQSTSQRSSFVGTMSVDQSDSSTYSLDSIRVDVVKKADNTADIIMYNVSFSPRMPMRIDMTISTVSYSVSASDTVFSGNAIVPTYNGIGFSNYTISNLTGSIANQALTLSMGCGSSPLRYSGR